LVTGNIFLDYGISLKCTANSDQEIRQRNQSKIQKNYWERHFE
jgi:hypothetical protein